MHSRAFAHVAALAALLTSCGGSSPDPEHASAGAYDRLERGRFNSLALRLNLPLYWAEDDDGVVAPDEVRGLLFYPSEGRWVEDGRFTAAFDEAYGRLVQADGAAAPSDARQALLFEELDSVAPTLLETDASTLTDPERGFLDHMLTVAGLIDTIYARQVGMAALAAQVDASDSLSASVFRRNWGPRCRGATTEDDPACSAIDGAPQPVFDPYPAELQTEGFCERLEARDDASEILSPFTVVEQRGEELVAVPYTERYAEMAQIATELEAAATALDGVESEEPLRAYLRAAAGSFRSNDWGPADEAWAAMNVRNSAWYVRVGPDEVYWDPCSQHAGFHLTLARINRGSLEWQDRLTPLQQTMEQQIADVAGDAYTARDVSFHLPDFIDIVVNAGDDRDAFGATIGQSLPNWGAVADEGRGRTVAMTNLYTDPDSEARRLRTARSLITEAMLARYPEDQTPALLSTILHEATHNLGPSHDYRVNGQVDTEAFGGGLASMLEELKAQSGALYYPLLLEREGILTREQVERVWLDSILWAFGHISRGMTTPSGQRKPYSQLAAVQVGFLMQRGAITFDAEALAANGEDRGAFSIDFAQMPEAVTALMTEVARIKATGDRAAAEALANPFVDGDVVPHALIRERYNRGPRASFVYAITR